MAKVSSTWVHGPLGPLDKGLYVMVLERVLLIGIRFPDARPSLLHPQSTRPKETTT